MIATAALAAAGPDAHLVHRPRGVLHAYRGPLTPSGHVPRRGRTVCKARTRRLTAVPEGSLLSPLDPSARRMCARCSARLALPAGPSSPLTTRQEWEAAYGVLTPFDLAVDAFMAETVEEVERLELLALLVVGFPACKTEPVVSPAGKESPPLDRHIAKARRRVGAEHGPRWAEADDLNRERAEATRRRERRELWDQREERIRQIGLVNAKS